MSVLGIVLAVIAVTGVIFSIFATGKINYRFYADAIAPIALSAWLGELICGIILLKQRKTIRSILIALGILVLILSMLMPATT
jgi:hypothetical protein